MFTLNRTLFGGNEQHRKKDHIVKCMKYLFLMSSFDNKKSYEIRSSISYKNVLLQERVSIICRHKIQKRDDIEDFTGDNNSREHVIEDV